MKKHEGTIVISLHTDFPGDENTPLQANETTYPGYRRFITQAPRDWAYDEGSPDRVYNRCRIEFPIGGPTNNDAWDKLPLSHVFEKLLVELVSQRNHRALPDDAYLPITHVAISNADGLIISAGKLGQPFQPAGHVSPTFTPGQLVYCTV